MAEALWTRDTLRRRAARLTIEQILCCSVCAESYIARWVKRVREIHSHRSQRRLITNSKAGRLNRIIEVLIVGLMVCKRYVAEPSVNIAHVFEEHTRNIRSEQWKA